MKEQSLSFGTRNYSHVKQNLRLKENISHLLFSHIPFSQRWLLSLLGYTAGLGYITVQFAETKLPDAFINSFNIMLDTSFYVVSFLGLYRELYKPLRQSWKQWFLLRSQHHDSQWTEEARSDLINYSLSLLHPAQEWQNLDCNISQLTWNMQTGATLCISTLNHSQITFFLCF